MADKKDTVDLTPRQTELLIGIVLCAKSKPDVDLEKYARTMKLSNAKSAQRQIHRIFEIISTSNAGGKDGATPKKKAAPKKRKKSIDDEDDESEETPTKNAAADESKESKGEENEDGEKVKGEDGFF